MVGNLAAAINLYYGNIVAYQQVLGLAGQALCEHGRVLDHPQFVFRFSRACGVERFHGFESWQVFDQTFLYDFHALKHHFDHFVRSQRPVDIVKLCLTGNVHVYARP